MKKKTIITTEKHEVWVVRQAPATPEADDQAASAGCSENESLPEAGQKESERALIQPKDESHETQDD